MARPSKQGVDYFPMDVHLDNKFKFVEIKYGAEGFGIVVKLLQNIYSQGYWSDWGEDEQVLFADEHKIDFSKLEVVVAECLKRGIFNNAIFEKHKVLTSAGIQKRYKEIVRRRKDVKVTTEYCLIDDLGGVNDDINPSSGRHNDDINPQAASVNDDISTQSKGKETKEDKSNKEKPKKNRHLDSVFLTADEYKRLVEDYTAFVVDSKIEDLDNYIGSTGKKYKDHNKTLRGWLKRDNPIKNVAKPAIEKPKEFVLNMNAGEG